MLKRIGIFLSLVAILVGCSSGGNTPTEPIHGTLTAIVTSYNSAQLTGTVPLGTKVNFDNSSHSGSRVGVGQTAQMLITGLPQGWITSMTVYAHSNKTSGAGELTLSVGDSTYLHYTGTMEDWIGHYTETDVPLSTSCAAISYCQEPILVTLTGTTNSLYLTQVAITFSTSAPPCDTIYLSYWDANIPVLDTLWEMVSGTGIDLPTCPTIYRSDSDWVHVGWVTQASMDTLLPPTYLPCGMTYHAAQHKHLWALYQYSSTHRLYSDTTYQSGEYALVRTNGMMAQGGWKKNKIAHDTITLMKAEQTYLWTADSVAKANRYNLDFDQDSVTIQVLGAQSTEWLGYAGDKTTTSPTPWAWKRAAEGSIYLYHDMQQDPQHGAYAYTIGIEGTETETTIQHRQSLWRETDTYWLLFPTLHTPEQSYRRWTTLN